jgi:hypothetical protein
MASWDQLYFKVINAWTKAGMASCVHVKGGDNKDDNFLLDCGVSESSTHSAKVRSLHSIYIILFFYRNSIA